MSSIIGIISVILCFAASLLGTIAVEAVSHRLGLIQAPNERSSHTRPTARGGGLAIAIVISVVWGLCAALGYGAAWLTALLIGMTSMLGFVDDLRDLSPGARFPIQIGIIAILVWGALPLPAISLFAGLSVTGPVLIVLVILAGTWWMNLFNFIDGIDGIAATQAILLLTCSSIIMAAGPAGSDIQPLLWLTASTVAAIAGFLVRNWPPARIFMGDAGSTVLALIILALALHTIVAGWMAYASWLILPAVLIADTTVTLIRRTAHGERPWRAHRRHAYQQLARIWGHRATTIGYGLITLLWAFPLAYATQHYASPAAWWLVAIAYIPLLALMGWLGAGSTNETQSLR